MSDSSETAPPPPEPPLIQPATEFPKIPPAWIIALLIVAPLLAFSPLFKANFVSWDDQDTITHNPVMMQPPAKAIPQFWANWRKPMGDIYVPLTQTVWSVLTVIAKRDHPDADDNLLNPGPYHATSILLHLLSTWLVYRLLRRLGAVDWAAAAGALLFALHPLQVETVAWISGLKDALSGTLSLVALLAFARFIQSDDDGRGRWQAYGWGTFAFIMAMFAKPSAVIVPVLAALVGIAAVLKSPSRSSWARNVLLPLLPWVLLAVPFALEGRYVQPGTDVAHPPLAERPLIAGDSLAFYLRQFIAPSRLAVDYGRNPTLVLRSGSLACIWLVPLAVVVAVIVLARFKRAPLLTIGLLIFFLAPFPVLGLFPFEFQQYSTVADHYLYVAMLGPAIIVAVLLSWVQPSKFQSAALATGAVLAILALTTFIQSRYWEDTMLLFDHNLVINPDSFAAHRVLGYQFARQDKIADAEKHYAAALQYMPEDPLTQMNWGDLLLRQGRAAEAAAHADAAAGRVPQAAAHASEAFDRFAAAADRFAIALKRMPDDPQLHNNMGIALAQTGQFEAAHDQFIKAINLYPNQRYANAEYNIAYTLALKAQQLAHDGKLNEAATNARGAVIRCKRALQIDPDYADARQLLPQLEAMVVAAQTAATRPSTHPTTSTSAPSTTRFTK